MSDTTANDGNEFDQPLPELEGLSLPVDARFGQRVRGRIERRVLAGDLVELLVQGPMTAVLELLHAPFSWFSRPPKP